MPSIRTNAANAAVAAAATGVGSGAVATSGHSTPSGGSAAAAVSGTNVGAIAALANNLSNLGLKERGPLATPNAVSNAGSGSISYTTKTTIGGSGVNVVVGSSSNESAAQNDGSHDSNKLNTDGGVVVSSASHKPELPPKITSRAREIAGYVGFANLPNQVYRKAVKRGFEFTLMVVGASGLGKSTLINSMFLTDIYDSEKYPGPSQRIKKTVAVESTKVLLKENGVNLTLTVVDTPGFGDSVDNSNCWVPILEYVDNKYEEFLTSESRVKRLPFPDARVHCCLYFIAPTGHGLRPLDIACMQSLSDKVNIIPVIAKSDTLTPDEVQLFKKQILNEIAQHKIKIYDFPKTPEETDEDEAKASNKLRSHIPFAVVGANTIIEQDGKKVRGRRYPWGIVEVENLAHCDFIALRNMVIRTHLQDLKEVTNDVHYENYRCKKLSTLGLVDGKGRLNNKNPLTQMEDEKREHELKMKKMEAEMEQVFDMKVREKQQKLRDSELELTRRHEERKKALEVQKKELEEQWHAFEKEKREWEETHHITLEELKRRSLGGHNSSDTIDSKKEKKKKGLF